ncbi:MAG: sugar ABC transporter permease, partial [Actinomycetota bacterium]
MDTSTKVLTMLLAILLFVAVVGVMLFIASRTERKSAQLVAYVFLFPSIVMLSVGLLYPAVKTIYASFFDAAGKAFIGLGNYDTIFTSSDEITVLRNTVLWVVVTPFVATAIGLLYAILVEGAKAEALAKAMIFLPMAISMVAASIIWKFVYEFRPDQPGVKQIGLLNQVLVWLGGSPQQWLLNAPWNT